MLWFESIAQVLYAPPSSRSGNKSPNQTFLENRILFGNFEFKVMSAIRELGGEAYGSSVSGYMLDHWSLGTSIAQVYVTLKRLEEKGFLSSRMDTPRPVRGGRARRVFQMEDKGLRALELDTAHRRALVSSANAERSTRHDDTQVQLPDQVPAFG